RGAGRDRLAGSQESRFVGTENADLGGPGIGIRGSQRADKASLERLLPFLRARGTSGNCAERGRATIRGNLGQIALRTLTKLIGGSRCLLFAAKMRKQG